MKALEFLKASLLVPAVAILVVVTGLPAYASGNLLAVAKPWHYWIAPVLAAVVLMVLLALSVGYFVRVVNPKHGFIRFGRR